MHSPLPTIAVRLTSVQHMFAKYLGDPEATAKAHDEDGYFKTGDSKSLFYRLVFSF